jgi:hypothetical protein
MMPPADIKPSELFLRLTETPCPTEIVPYPRESEEGGVDEVRMLVLREELIGRKRIDARRHVQKKYKMSDLELDSDVGQRMVSDRVAKEILAIAVVLPDPIPGSVESHGYPVYERLFMTADSIGKLPPREIGILWGLWNLVQNRIGPNESSFQSDDEVEAWLKVLVEGARPFGFFLLDLPQQEELLGKLASRALQLYRLLGSPQESWHSSLVSLQESLDIGTSSPTSQPADSTLYQSHRDQIEHGLDADEAREIAQKMRLRSASRLTEDLKD